MNQETNRENLAAFAVILNVIGLLSDLQCTKVLSKLFLERNTSPIIRGNMNYFESLLGSRCQTTASELQVYKPALLRYWTKLVSQRGVQLLELYKDLPNKLNYTFWNHFLNVHDIRKDITIDWESITLSICGFLNLHFDCSNITTFELDDLKQQHPVLLKVNSLFINLPSQASTKTTSTKTPAPKAANATGSYISAGPQSSNVSALVGNPGNKVYFSASHVYAIIADKTGKNTPALFVHPVTNNTYKEKAVLVPGTAQPTALFKFGSANGYTDCICYFESRLDAETVCTAVSKVFTNYSNIRVVETAIDKNGYYQVCAGLADGFTTTKCYVRAKKLNEEVLNDKTDLQEETAKHSDNITDIETYHEWINKSCC